MLGLIGPKKRDIETTLLCLTCRRIPEEIVRVPAEKVGGNPGVHVHRVHKYFDREADRDICRYGRRCRLERRAPIVRKRPGGP